MGRPANGGAESLLRAVREGRSLTLGEQLRLTLLLSWPAVVAQLSAMAMQYIDAAMVGHLGAEASAAVGLVATSTWLFWGTLSAAATGFTVQVAQLVGANNARGARSIVRQAVVATAVFGLLLAVVGIGVSGPLPGWLGADAEIAPAASRYFLIFALFLPALQLNFLAGGMLRCSGNMHVPGLMGVAMCAMDVVFNFLLIYPTREVTLGGFSVTLPGAGLGVEGAALGTGLAELLSAAALLFYLWRRSSVLGLIKERGSFNPRRTTLRKAVRTALPMGVEHVVICGAQIMTTVIVAPLGVTAIAANALAVTAESLCYMPGYGIAEAATTLVGQSLGAGRHDLMRRFALITVTTGMAIMGLMGVALYVFAPDIMGLMTPVADIRQLGAAALRIEAFAEPMFAASIVAYGVFVGTGRTLVPSLMNFGSIWCVRLTLAALLAPTMGLHGVWLAMCVELCFRGAIFLWRLGRGRWAAPAPLHL